MCPAAIQNRMDTSSPHRGISETAETGATIRIEQLADHAAIVRVTYPVARRRRDLKFLKVICACLCLIPLASWFLFRNGITGWFAVTGSAILSAYIMSSIVRQFRAHTRSYVLRADHSGLTIETSNGKDATMEYFTRDQTCDITVRFSFYRGPNSLFKCWLEIQTTTRATIQCLHDIGGDHLARIANVLRAALCMPARSWP